MLDITIEKSNTELGYVWDYQIDGIYFDPQKDEDIETQILNKFLNVLQIINHPKAPKNLIDHNMKYLNIYLSIIEKMDGYANLVTKELQASCGEFYPKRLNEWVDLPESYEIVKGWRFNKLYKLMEEIKNARQN